MVSPLATAPAHYLIAYTDGGARGNPGPAGFGVVLQDETGRKIAGLSQYLGHQTNNVAEYQGLIAALEYAVERGPRALKVISDSELLVKQVRGEYKVRKLTAWRMRPWTRVWAGGTQAPWARTPRPHNSTGNLKESSTGGLSG